MRKDYGSLLGRAIDTGVAHSIVIFLFYFSILIMNQFLGPIVRIFYYATAICACYLGLFPDGKRMSIPKEILAFSFLVFLTGILNILVVGNSDLMKLIYTVISVGIALLLLNNKVHPNALLAAVLINAAVIVWRLLVYGPEGPFYISSSANFVSVHLLLPAVVYYAVVEAQKKKLHLWPAFLIWVLCLLAKGRAGILFSTFFFGSLVLYVFVQKMRAATKRTRMICYSVAGALIVAVVICFVAFDLVHKVDLFNRFALHGLTGNGRDLIWNQYLLTCISDLKAFVFAPDLTTLFRVIQHEGNLHNSFMNVHAFNGIVMLLVFLAMCCYAALYAIKKGRWIFLICFLTICLRGFTDYVFWGTSGTPFVLYFLLMPIIETQKRGCYKLSIPEVWAFLSRVAKGKKEEH